MSQSLLYLPAQAMRPSLARSTLAQPSTLLLCARCSARQSPSILHSRQFTTARRNDAAMGEMQPVDNSSLAVFKQPSRKARMQKMAGKQLGQDLGRIPNALIMPAAKQLPKWLSRDFFKRFRILYLHLKSSVKDWVGIWTFLWWDAPRDPMTGRKLRKNMELSQRTEIARRLHQEFNTALSTGNIKQIQTIACEGLTAQARARIGRRRTYARSEEPWEIVKYLGIDYPSWLNNWPISVLLPNASLRVVEDKINPLPLANSYMRQCTVRIKSLQHYLPADTEEALLMIHTDYIIIQKMTIRGEDSPWMLWGTVEPSTMAEINKLLDGGSDVLSSTFTERLRQSLPTLPGF